MMCQQNFKDGTFLGLNNKQNVSNAKRRKQMEKATIMLVDDEELVIKSIKRSLWKEGYQFLEYTDASQALEALKSVEVDVIISDQRMPGMNGMEFLIQARKLYPNTVRILLTGYSDIGVAIEAINEGRLYRYLSKPWDDAELKSTILNSLKLRKIIVENRKLTEQIQEPQDYIPALEHKPPVISKIKHDNTGAIILEDLDEKKIFKHHDRGR
jgi:DNA-binding NtrC family response regulator